MLLEIDPVKRPEISTIMKSKCVSNMKNYLLELQQQKDE